MQTFLYLGDPLTTSNRWSPIPDFRITDGDLGLTQIDFGNIVYQLPNQDAVYGTVPLSRDYRPATDVGFVACIDKVQIGSADGTKFTSLPSISQVAREIEDIGLNMVQKPTAQRLLISGETSTSYNVLNTLGVAALQAQRKVTSTVSTVLSDTAWQDEVRFWFQVMLADMQGTVVDFVYKSPTAMDADVPLAFLDSASAREESNLLREQCHSQATRTLGSHQTFLYYPFLALWIAAAGTIILSLTVEPLIGWAIGGRRHMQWRMDGFAQMLRPVYQHIAESLWERCRDEIPLLVRERLGLARRRVRPPLVVCGLYSATGRRSQVCVIHQGGVAKV